MPLANVLCLKIEEQLQEEFSFTSKLSEQKKSYSPNWPHVRNIFKN
jgi:hypothetical protein